MGDQRREFHTLDPSIIGSRLGPDSGGRPWAIRFKIVELQAARCGNNGFCRMYHPRRTPCVEKPSWQAAHVSAAGKYTGTAGADKARISPGAIDGLGRTALISNPTSLRERWTRVGL